VVALNLTCVALYLIQILDKMRTASTEDSRRRMRVLSAGTGFGMGALLIVFALLPWLGYNPGERGHVWVAYVGMLCFLVAPFTLAYVVVVQRALDVRILVRTGTRYALARVTLWVVQFLLVAAIARRGFEPLVERRTPEPFDMLMLTLFVAVFLFLRFGGRQKIRSWVDRKFFREAYNSEQVLSELSEQVRKFAEAKPLLELVARRVGETLHVQKIGLLMSGSDGFTLQQAVGIPADGELRLRLGSSTIRNLTITNSPARLYREDPDPWYLMADDLERETLDAMHTELLLPLTGRSRLMGVMALGPKKSEAAYSRSDLHLLQMVAAQTGMALEVSELAVSLANEAAQRERAMREMEIAREVQERLFPQEMPCLDGATIAGACRPAMGVGGDYYDVFALADGRLGLAIGDVSGKGISAALLMASLRASLRGVTLDSPRDFARLMHKVNRLVYEASASNRYATFFFAAFDPRSHVLECVNAGHNPPVVLRRMPDGRTQTILIEADGPVVGLILDAPYTEQSLQLQPGDLLLAYTDGISEAMNRREDEWGEERMVDAAAEVLESPASEVLRKVFAAADKFTAGAPQHDDMTLLVLKLGS
jgi:sigma-B regulation protein RsbU (phosphoserine phosphatase)